MFKIWSPAVGLHSLEANLGTLRPPKNAFGVTLEQKKTKKKKKGTDIFWINIGFPKKGSAIGHSKQQVACGFVFLNLIRHV